MLHIAPTKQRCYVNISELPSRKVDKPMKSASPRVRARLEDWHSSLHKLVAPLDSSDIAALNLRGTSLSGLKAEQIATQIRACAVFLECPITVIADQPMALLICNYADLSLIWRLIRLLLAAELATTHSWARFASPGKYDSYQMHLCRALPDL